MSRFSNAVITIAGHSGPAARQVCTPEEAINRFWRGAKKEGHKLFSDEVLGAIAFDGKYYKPIFGATILANENLAENVRALYGGRIASDFVFWVRSESLPGQEHQLVEVIENQEMRFRCGAIPKRVQTMWTTDGMVQD